jgi:polyisoprenoid-binding protein YceI
MLAFAAASLWSDAADEARQSNPGEPALAAIPAGAYTLDKAHASLIFRVNHLGFSDRRSPLQLLIQILRRAVNGLSPLRLLEIWLR